MKRIAIWGYSGENILRTLAADLRSLNNEVIEISLDPRTLNPVDQCIDLLITSNHFTRSKDQLTRYFPEFVEEFNSGLSDFFDVDSALRPKRLGFVCHDHRDLFVLNEQNLLNRFDFVNAPYYSLYKNPSNVEIVAFDLAFRNREHFDSIAVSNRIIWFVSHVSPGVKRLGTKGYAAYILSKAPRDVWLKLPEFHLSEGVEDKLREAGFNNIIPSSHSTEELIRSSRIVVSNTDSGISALATVYQKPVIVLPNPNFSEDRMKQALRDCLSFPNHVFLEDIHNVPDLENATRRGISAPAHCSGFRNDFAEWLIQSM